MENLTFSCNVRSITQRVILGECLKKPVSCAVDGETFYPVHWTDSRITMTQEKEEIIIMQMNSLRADCPSHWNEMTLLGQGCFAMLFLTLHQRFSLSVGLRLLIPAQTKYKNGKWAEPFSFDMIWLMSEYLVSMEHSWFFLALNEEWTDWGHFAASMASSPS